jgi:hypothetical protein
MWWLVFILGFIIVPCLFDHLIFELNYEKRRQAEQADFAAQQRHEALMAKLDEAREARESWDSDD